MADNHHGSTPAAWTGVAVAMVAFVLGSVAIMRDPVNQTWLWVALVLGALALPIFLVMARLGLHGGHDDDHDDDHDAEYAQAERAERTRH